MSTNTGPSRTIIANIRDTANPREKPAAKQIQQGVIARCIILRSLQNPPFHRLSVKNHTNSKAPGQYLLGYPLRRYTMMKLLLCVVQHGAEGEWWKRCGLPHGVRWSPGVDHLYAVRLVFAHQRKAPSVHESTRESLQHQAKTGNERTLQLAGCCNSAARPLA